MENYGSLNKGIVQTKFPNAFLTEEPVSDTFHWDIKGSLNRQLHSTKSVSPSRHLLSQRSNVT